MSEKPWKKTERGLATRLGGRRVPITGRQRGDAPDIAHETFAIEVKQRKMLPGWLVEAMAQAKACQKSEAQLPIVILREKRRRFENAIVCMSLADFESAQERQGQALADLRAQLGACESALAEAQDR